MPFQCSNAAILSRNRSVSRGLGLRAAWATPDIWRATPGSTLVTRGIQVFVKIWQLRQFSNSRDQDKLVYLSHTNLSHTNTRKKESKTISLFPVILLKWASIAYFDTDRQWNVFTFLSYGPVSYVVFMWVWVHHSAIRVESGPKGLIFVIYIKQKHFTAYSITYWFCLSLEPHLYGNIATVNTSIQKGHSSTSIMLLLPAFL